MRRSEDFTGAVRGGARGGTRRLVVHLTSSDDATTPRPALAGLVVPRAVGNAVARNLVKRRLRGVLAVRMMSILHDGERLVVRALPAAAEASSAVLAADLDSAVDRARRRSPR